MEAVIFIGIQASGKSTFYRQRFFDTHLRLSLDMLNTRHRQRLLVQACIATMQPFVLDNTNVLRQERAAAIEPARTKGFQVEGYFFEPRVDQALTWNKQRKDKNAIPVKGLLGTLKRLERPELQEGFDSLYRVHAKADGTFEVERWQSR